MSEKIKIFQFPFADSNSGVMHYAFNNWKYLDKDKFSCDFGTVRKYLDKEEEIIKSGANVKYFSCRGEENKNQFVKELKMLFSEGYDIVHLHTSFWKSFLVEEVAIECNIPKIIVHSHGTHVNIQDDIERKKAEKIHNIRRLEFDTSLATEFCACSNIAADWLFGPKIPREKIKIMKNAIDVEKFTFSEDIRYKLRKELDIEDNFVIGHVGRFAFSKNHEFLIEVFSQVVKINPNIRLVLVGAGELENNIKELVSKLGIEDKVIFTGVRNDVNFLMQAFDLFCLPSRAEALGIALVEAQAAGLKCIASEFVPDEVFITSNIIKLPLELNNWRDAILESVLGYERVNMEDIITEAGYNIKHQIKEVEKLYSDF